MKKLHFFLETLGKSSLMLGIVIGVLAIIFEFYLMINFIFFPEIIYCLVISFILLALMIQRYYKVANS